MAFHPAKGIGSFPIGVFIVGYGEPATIDPIIIGKSLIDNIGNQQDAIYIDASTKDYTITTQGNMVGQTTVSQQVYLAMTTGLGSASLTTLGNTLFKVDRVDPILYQNQIKNIVYNALDFLTSKNTITINNIIFSSGKNSNNTSILFTIVWTDNTENTQNQTVVSI